MHRPTCFYPYTYNTIALCPDYDPRPRLRYEKANSIGTHNDH